MFTQSPAFSGYSVDNLDKAEVFYKDVLGCSVERDWMGLKLTFVSGQVVFIYQKDEHTPASFTVLNFPVDNVDEAVDHLIEQGITMEKYDQMPGEQDEKGILHGKAVNMGPDIAWFKDPAGNILAVLSKDDRND